MRYVPVESLASFPAKSYPARRLVPTLALVMAFLIGSQGMASADHRWFGTDGHSPSCWGSEQSVRLHRIDYQIDASIPYTWNDWIRRAAAAWTNVTTSSFSFSDVASSPNKVRVVYLGPTEASASVTAPERDYNTIFAPVTMRFNSAYSHGPVDGWDYHPQDTATHEFGHFLWLKNIWATGCETQTMWWYQERDQTSRTSLEQHDKEGISWQHP